MLCFFISTAIASPEFNGSLESNVRISPEGELLDFQDTMMFSPRLEIDEQVNLVVDLDIRWSPFLQLESIDDTQNIQTVQPVSFRAEELWVQYSSALLKTTIGMQNILWGAGKGISQVNWMAPLDLRNPVLFSEYISVPAIKLSGQKGAFSVETILQPWFTPSLLPKLDISIFPDATDSFSIEDRTLDVRSQEGRIRFPNQGVETLQAGGRFSLHQSRFDLSVFGFYGRDTLPQANGEFLLMGFQTDQDRVDVGIPLEYPRIATVGSTASLILPLDILSWFEFSYIIPEKTQLIASERQMNGLVALGTLEERPDPLPSLETQDGAAYTKWLIGIERYFGNITLSGQWLHGLFIERQASAINDYLLLNADWAIQPTLRWSSTVITDGAGLFLQSDVHWLIQDRIDLGVGGLWIPERPSSQLANFQKTQHLFGSMSYLF